MDETQVRLYMEELRKYRDRLATLITPNETGKSLLQHEYEAVAQAILAEHRFYVRHSVLDAAEHISKLPAVLTAIGG